MANLNEACCSKEETTLEEHLEELKTITRSIESASISIRGKLFGEELCETECKEADNSIESIIIKVKSITRETSKRLEEINRRL